MKIFDFAGKFLVPFHEGESTEIRFRDQTLEGYGDQEENKLRKWICMRKTE